MHRKPLGQNEKNSDAKDNKNAAAQHLNGTQKSILEGTLQYMIDPLKLLKPSDAIRSLKAIYSDAISAADYKHLQNLEVLGCIDDIRKILSHPCPENRSGSLSDVGQENGFAMYRSEKSNIKSTTKDGDLVLLNGRVIPKACIIRNSNMDDFFIAKEKMGLLGLTSREDKVTPPVTKKDVCDYIMVNVNQVRTEMEAKLKSDEKQKLPGLFKSREKSGKIHIEVDGKPMDIPWKQPEQTVHLIFNDAKIADNFIKTLRIILADDRQFARLSNEKLLIQNYHAEGLPNHAVAVRLTYTQFRTVQDKLAPLPAAPGGPKTK